MLNRGLAKAGSGSERGLVSRAAVAAAFRKQVVKMAEVGGPGRRSGVRCSAPRGPGRNETGIPCRERGSGNTRFFKNQQGDHPRFLRRNAAAQRVRVLRQPRV